MNEGYERKEGFLLLYANAEIIKCPSHTDFSQIRLKDTVNRQGFKLTIKTRLEFITNYFFSSNSMRFKLTNRSVQFDRFS